MHEEEVLRDPHSSKVYWALPALIRLREFLLELQQFQKKAFTWICSNCGRT
ncbi:hypothetical protein Krac_1681 [Ktedonobacter racemifer DSM 44963]|uniref:Uncharacterized protein n=1 Tax=Ktedonobacter racemifer DSM 44963 TaxID=485913 RepID=D6U2Q7_KTERA|nr:hypothetical protein Krac_1681 [Ktedonobacter racemifer DSM 44963]